jgi:rhodanese-related sulfurtransferase
VDNSAQVIHTLHRSGRRGRIEDVTSPEIPSVPVDAVPAEFDDAGTTPATLLDVREDDEWQLGHAPGAVHIPMADIPARAEELDYDREIYVICRQGGRSLQVVRYLTHIGFDAVNIAGGMVAWQKAGRPLTAEGDHEAKIY